MRLCPKEVESKIFFPYLRGPNPRVETDGQVWSELLQRLQPFAGHIGDDVLRANNLQGGSHHDVAAVPALRVLAGYEATDDIAWHQRTIRQSNLIVSLFYLVLDLDLIYFRLCWL